MNYDAFAEAEANRLLREGSDEAYAAYANNTLVEQARLLLTQTTGLRDDDHGEHTPERFVRMLKELTTAPSFEFTTFPNKDGVDEIVAVRDIPFVSLCNHHVIPFIGVAHVGYIPDELIVGLSKLARVVKHFAARLQVQERMTHQIAEFISEELNPQGVGVVVEAEHLCMTIRGVQTPGTLTTTSKMMGVFGDHDRTAKSEFLRLIGK